MNTLRSIGLALTLSPFAVGFVGCGSTDGGSANETASSQTSAVVAASELYIVAHKDTRTCAAPLCGGYYVKSLNAAVTVCDDGVARAECYVDAFDFATLAGQFTKQPAELSTTVSAADYATRLATANTYLEAQIKAGGAVVTGRLQTVVVSGKRVGELVANKGWIGLPWAGAPTGEFYVIACTNATCAPTPALREQPANSCAAAKTILDLDLSKVPPPGDSPSSTPVAANLEAGLQGVNELLVLIPATLAATAKNPVQPTKLPSVSYVVSGTNVMSGATVEWLTASDMYSPMGLFYYALLSSGGDPASFFGGS